MRRGMRGFCGTLRRERVSGSQSAIAATRLDSSIRSIHSIAALCASRILHCIGFNILVALELINSPLGKGSGQELRPYLPTADNYDRPSYRNQSAPRVSSQPRARCGGLDSP